MDAVEIVSRRLPQKDELAPTDLHLLPAYLFVSTYVRACRYCFAHAVSCDVILVVNLRSIK